MTTQADQPGIERLRAHLRSHNRRVLAITLLTFAITAALWAVLYAVAWWLFLLFGTAVKSTAFQPNARPVVRDFLLSGFGLCLIAWFIRRVHPDESPVDRKNAWDHAADVILALPRLTLSMLGSGLATARLRGSDLEYAWDILQRLREAGQPVSVSQLPIRPADPGTRERILMALQVSDVIQIRGSSSGPVLAFSNDEARRLADTWVRLRV